jgi:hypothetical protein
LEKQSKILSREMLLRLIKDMDAKAIPKNAVIIEKQTEKQSSIQIKNVRSGRGHTQRDGQERGRGRGRGRGRAQRSGLVKK